MRTTARTFIADRTALPGIAIRCHAIGFSSAPPRPAPSASPPSASATRSPSRRTRGGGSRWPVADLHPNARRILVSLAAMVRDGLLPSLRDLVDETGLGRGTVDKWLTEMTRMGLVVRASERSQARVPSAAGWSLVAKLEPSLIALPLARRIAALTEEQRAALLDLVDLMESETRERGWRRAG